MWSQWALTMPAQPRGCHLITDVIEQALATQPAVGIGLLHLFLQHTSASLTINENACPDVRADLEMAASRIASEQLPYTHTSEGSDDMPGHVKTALFGHDLTIPVQSHRLVLGQWQGIYFWEHRNQAGPRTIVLTLQGSSDAS